MSELLRIEALGFGLDYELLKGKISVDFSMDTNKYINYSDLAYEYNVAAMLLWNNLPESSYLFNPFMFLSRHTIELLLKGLIEKNCLEDNQHEIDQKGKTRAMSSTHNLSALWNHYLKYRQDVQISLSSKADERNITQIIRKIDSIDLNSTNYRYPYHKDGSRLTLDPIKISNNTDNMPSIGQKPPLIVERKDGIHVVSSGKNNLLLGEQIILIIEKLFDLIEQ